MALKRNVLALAVFERLPLGVAEMAICELTNLLSSGFRQGGSGDLHRPAWRVSDLLLPHLKNVAVSRREDFAGVLYLGGYDVEVPDIMRSDPRP
jgi:hypothetical protein